MPEGNVIHHQARRLGRAFTRHAVSVDSPQGRFADGAARIDGHVVRKVEAHGKHLFIGFDNRLWVHVHLGLFGKWRIGRGEAPEPVVGLVRMRLRTDEAFAELRGPTVCEVLDEDEKKAAVRRIGPDPIRKDADPSAARDRVLRSTAPDRRPAHGPDGVRGRGQHLPRGGALPARHLAVPSRSRGQRGRSSTPCGPTSSR